MGRFRGDYTIYFHVPDSEGQFGQIVELWEGQRDSLGTDPTLYPLVVMALERAGQAELVQTFLEDGSDSALEEGRRRYIYTFLSVVY